jgi:hypothetical protein
MIHNLTNECEVKERGQRAATWLQARRNKSMHGFDMHRIDALPMGWDGIQ